MKRIALAMGLVLTLAAGSAQASLISVNDAFYGANSLTHDTVSNLDWLDLTLSTNLSINQILGGVGQFLARGFQIATLAQTEAMMVSGGWNGGDDTFTTGAVAHHTFVINMISLFGQVGTGADGPFTEGFALTTPGLAARVFMTQIIPNDTLGRVACTTAGYAVATGTDTTAGCRASYDWAVPFSGTFLVRPAGPAAAVPEPATLVMLASGLLAVGVARRRARG
jgi:PEP-CTERM motif